MVKVCNKLMVKQLYSIIRSKASLNRSTETNAILQLEMICLPIKKKERKQHCLCCRLVRPLGERLRGAGRIAGCQALYASGCRLVTGGRWLLAVGFWPLAVGFWLLAVSFWPLARNFVFQSSKVSMFQCFNVSVLGHP